MSRSTPPARISGQAEAHKAPPTIASARAVGTGGARSGQLAISVRATATTSPFDSNQFAHRQRVGDRAACEEIRMGSRRPPRLSTA